MTTPDVDFFRIDRSGPTKRLLIAGAILVAAGASGVGAHLMHRLSPETSHLVSLLGGISMIGGLVTTFGALAMLLFENVYLSIRDDGVLMHDNGKETVVVWDALTTVTVDKGVVEIQRTEKSPLRWFAGKGAANVASRIEEAKRKASVKQLVS